MKRIEEEYKRWLLRQDVDIFATVTLKQGIRRDFGLEPLTIGAAENTAWKLRDRLTKRAVGPAAYRAGGRLPFIAMCEGHGIWKRRHLHILTKKPEYMPFEEYEGKFLHSLHKLEWAWMETDVQTIDSVSATIQ